MVDRLTIKRKKIRGLLHYGFFCIFVGKKLPINMKTPIKISESELCKIIKDSTMNVLNNHNDSVEREQLRDYLSKIPEEALKRQNVNLKITPYGKHIK